MKRGLTLLIVLISAQSLMLAQNLGFEPKYIFPVEGVEPLYSANFGELRAAHFHSGVDIKTEGVEGKRVISVDDGYVSRIAHQSSGYGLALYITHKDGTTAVYAHLQRFKKEIDNYVDSERRRQKLNNINLYPSADKFPIKKGELIALSGNTGSSGGPHLHFEVRDANQRPMNPLLNRMLAVRDNLAPTLARLHYIEVDTLAGIVHHSKVKSYNLVRNGGNRYRIEGANNTISVGAKGYFAVEGVDIKCDVTNIFALTKVDGYIDGEPFFSYLMDGFAFDGTRYRHGVTQYQLKDGNRNEVIRLAQAEGSTKEHYSTMVESGVIRTEPNEVRELKIVVEDDMGNASTVEVTLKGAANSFTAPTQVEGEPIYYNQDFSFRGDGLAVSIPKGSLYESCYFTYTKEDASIRPALHSLSEVYTVMDRTLPLHSYINVSVRVDSLPTGMESKCGIATTTKSGNRLFLGGSYSDGVVSARVRNLGDYFVIVDNTPPVIRSRFKSGGNLSGYNYVSFDLSDDLSGTRSYSATLDGVWIPLELTGGVLRYNFREAVDGKAHQIIITATDSCNNTATHTYNFTR